MATESKVFDDSTSVFNPPPTYDAISTPISADSVRRYKRSVSSFLQSKQKRRATAFSRIREIVSSPDFTPSSVGPIVDSCATALPASEFSDLLQQRNIEDHTALYWAIVKKRREALWAFTKFISEFSPACSSDLRFACMAINDHDLFMQLNLGDNVNPKDKSLRRMLGCPRDEIQVLRDGLVENRYIVRLVFKMFQTRLRIMQKFAVEFIARGRIWVLRIFMHENGRWYIGCALSEYSSPVVHPDVDVIIQPHRPSPGFDTPELILHLRLPSNILVPKGSCERYTAPEPGMLISGMALPLYDWLMDDDTTYVDCDGTLTVALRMTMT
ncbi:hypothetical protein DEU56DRAFT_293113 [Suillus clintonianus]|uniref:uncharacterized protein n=1 Tax=Suillus clintonianus TaxID=1904413 RepID=UPI001B879EEA|nr:uncharacterized protein DEU56DRAFT_293113 [Suillus clintonianus]KAG2140095.1 hypothetical protein DEU56DRAFT_293113 [Suillus clintonianus]